MEVTSPRYFRFGNFELDLRTGDLMRQGLRLKLQEQPFKVLAMLIAKRGELVTREELRNNIWSDSQIDVNHGINKAISKIRQALRDSATHPRFVETVARLGYRFLAEVAIGEASGTHLVPKVRSMAVLPLEDLSGKRSQEYFADGMTDELIMRLGQISALRVISRTSVMGYKNTRKSLAQIARELGVEALVEGTVLRAGRRVRITAQLIEALAEKRLWAHSYDENFRDVIGLQHRVARSVAEGVQATLSRKEQVQLDNTRPVKPRAYEAYLKGRFFWNKRTEQGLRKAIECFDEAIEADPTYAAAYAGLSDCYALSGDWQHGILSPKYAFPRARAAAERALALDKDLGEAHASLAFALDLYYWDWILAEKEHKRAIALNPSYATAYQWYAWHLIVTGRKREALSELRNAENLDPFSLIIGADLADALCIAGLYDQSIAQSRKILDMDANFALGHYQLGQAYMYSNMMDKAIAEFRTAIALAGESAVLSSSLAYALAKAGRRNEAIAIVGRLERTQSRESPSHSNIALGYVGLGDKDNAMAWLERAYRSRFNPSILMRPGFDPLRTEARFHALLGGLGLS
jgi:TolB-like protein/Tfp pilus assembly protein PilF